MFSEWLGGLGAAAGVLLAICLYLRRRAGGRRSAALVSIDAQWLPASDEIVVTVRNGGMAPIWNCVVTVCAGDGEIYNDVWGPVTTGSREHRFPGMRGAAVTSSAVEFTDQTERRWRRDARGALTDLGRVGYRRYYFSCSGG